MKRPCLASFSPKGGGWLTSILAGWLAGWLACVCGSDGSAAAREFLVTKYTLSWRTGIYSKPRKESLRSQALAPTPWGLNPRCSGLSGSSTRATEEETTAKSASTQPCTIPAEKGCWNSGPLPEMERQHRDTGSPFCLSRKSTSGGLAGIVIGQRQTLVAFPSAAESLPQLSDSTRLAVWKRQAPACKAGRWPCYAGLGPSNRGVECPQDLVHYEYGSIG